MPLNRIQVGKNSGIGVSGSFVLTLPSAPTSNANVYWMVFASSSSTTVPISISHTGATWQLLQFVIPSAGLDVDLWFGKSVGGQTPAQSLTINLSSGTANMAAIVAEYLASTVLTRQTQGGSNFGTTISPPSVTPLNNTKYAGIFAAGTQYNEPTHVSLSAGYSVVTSQGSNPGFPGSSGHVTAHLAEKLPVIGTGASLAPIWRWSQSMWIGGAHSIETLDLQIEGSVVIPGTSTVVPVGSRTRTGQLVIPATSGIFPRATKVLPELLPGFPISRQGPFEAALVSLNSDPSHRILVDSPNDFIPKGGAPSYDLSALGFEEGNKLKLIGAGPNGGRTFTLSNPTQLNVLEKILSYTTDVTEYEFEVIRRKA